VQKIPTLFLRDEQDRRYVTREPHPDAQWVLDGEGVPTRKYDGTCVMLDQYGIWWARREVKPGKPTPPGYRPISTDEVTGKTMGWEPIGQSSFAKAFDSAAPVSGDELPDEPGTYELVGPKVNGNPEGFEHHALIPHGRFELDSPGRTYDELASWLAAHSYEGIVWHHPDGVRYAKLKRRDIRPTP
jgi:hypothetical protein